MNLFNFLNTIPHIGIDTRWKSRQVVTIMAHTLKHKTKLLNRTKRIRGQIDGILRLLEEETDCSKVLQSIAACRGAMNGLMHQILEGHILEHVLDKSKRHTKQQSIAADELIGILKTYLK